MELSEYMARHSLSLDVTKVEDDMILQNDELLAEVCAMWTEHKGALVAVIQARVNAIALRILNSHNIALDSVIYQQAFVEVGAIVKDFEKYHVELAKRDTETEEGNEEDKGEDTKPDPPVKEGDEGSL